MIEVRYKNVRLVMRRATVRDDLHSQKIRLKLDAAYAADTGVGFWQLFSDLVSGVSECEGLPFDPKALPDAPSDDVARAYEAFLDMPKVFKNRWRDAMERANADTDEAGEPTDDPNG